MFLSMHIFLAEAPALQMKRVVVVLVLALVVVSDTKFNFTF